MFETEVHSELPQPTTHQDIRLNPMTFNNIFSNDFGGHRSNAGLIAYRMFKYKCPNM